MCKKKENNPRLSWSLWSLCSRTACGHRDRTRSHWPIANAWKRAGFFYASSLWILYEWRRFEHILLRKLRRQSWSQDVGKIIAFCTRPNVSMHLYKSYVHLHFLKYMLHQEMWTYMHIYQSILIYTESFKSWRAGTILFLRILTCNLFDFHTIWLCSDICSHQKHTLNNIGALSNLQYVQRSESISWNK